MSQASARFRAPWQSRDGQFSPMRAMVLALCTLPVGWIAYQTSLVWLPRQALGALPLPTVLYFSGTTAIWLLLAALAVTPVRSLGGWNRLSGVRRILGVAAFAYTAAHVISYFVMRIIAFAQIRQDAALMRELGEFSVAYELAEEMVVRPSLNAALAATLVICALAATSTDGMVGRLGAKWKRLHKLVYPATGLAILHYSMSPGSGAGGEPYVMAGIFILLMGWRVLAERELGRSFKPLLMLAMASAALTFGFELLSLGLFHRLSVAEASAVALNPPLGASPALQVLIVGIAAASLVLLRPNLAYRPG